MSVKPSTAAQRGPHSNTEKIWTVPLFCSQHQQSKSLLAADTKKNRRASVSTGIIIHQTLLLCEDSLALTTVSRHYPHPSCFPDFWGNAWPQSSVENLRRHKGESDCAAQQASGDTNKAGLLKQEELS
ncbi:unnamed protein product [Pleuronectes platessa]|uniref:Uncharacterized protein n=1 Tax=Pleuronectes platessa TaxID=8262 RepID=A0A9N7TKZ6_PLEPL|nr:unnamed protein product [Pleuronectes platessa]